MINRQHLPFRVFPLLLQCAGYLINRVAILTVIAVFLLSQGTAGATSDPVRSATEIEYPPFCIVEPDGRVTGFSNELLRAAVAAMDREVTFRTGTWPEVRQWLARGEVEALPLVGRTPEREELFDFTFAYMSLHGAIVVRDTLTGVNNLDDLRGKTVGVMQGDNSEEFLRREDRGITIQTTPTFEIALRNLSSGQYDAVVIQRLVALRLIQELGLTNVRVIDKPVHGFRQDFCFAVKEGDRETLALLNEGLSIVMADGTYRRLHSQWFATLQLPGDRPIIVGGDHNFPPFEFLDEQGRPTGFNVELTRAIAREMDLDFKIRLGPWTDIRQALANGEIDVIQGMFYSEERDNMFDFTPAHSVNHQVSVVRESATPTPGTIDDLAGKQIVVQRGDIMHDFVLEHNLSDQVTAVETQEAALSRLASGEFDCALGSRLTALYWINKKGWTNLTVGRKSFVSPEYAFAVINNDQALLSTFTDGLHVLKNSGELRDLNEKWYGVYEPPQSSIMQILRTAAFIIVPLLLVAGLAFLWAWSLRKQVARRTEELWKSEEGLRESEKQYRRFFETAQDGMLILDAVSGEILDANPFIQELLGYTKTELQGKYLWEIGAFQDIAANKEHFTKLKEQGVVRYDHLPLQTKEGNEAHVEFVSNTYLVGEQEIIQCNIRDITDRKQQEREYKELLDGMNDTVFVIGFDGQFLEVNQTAEEVLGYSREELLTMGPTDLDPHLSEAEIQNLITSLSEDKIQVFETKHRTKDGEVIPIEISSSIITYFGEQAALSVGRDISERKRAERELEFRAQMLASVGEAVIVANPEGQVIYWNQAAEAMYGWTAGEAVGQNVLDLTPSPGMVESSREIMKELSAGNQWAGEMLVRRKDGTEFPALVTDSPILNEDGELSAIIGVSRDITDRKEMETRYAGLFNSLWDATIITSLEGKILDANPATESLFGYTLEEVKGGSPKRFYQNPEEYEQMEKELDQQRADEEISKVIEYKKKDGKTFRGETAVNHLTDMNGVLLGYIVIIRDITEKEQMEQELIESQKMEALGQIAGGIAHDFNNVMAAISGAQQMLELQIKNDALQRYLNMIKSSVERGKAVTNRMLTFTRSSEIDIIPVALGSFLEEFKEMARYTLPQHVDIQLEGIKDSHSVLADPAQLQQVLFTLSLNATDAMPEGGTIRFAVRQPTDRERRVFLSETSEPYWCLLVSDEGIGMEEATMKRIFEPFFTTKESSQGTGLGLPVAYKIVQMHDGWIDVSSTPGEGATFIVGLPACDPKEPGTVETNSMVPGEGETILIVDDEKSIRHMLDEALSGSGYTAIQAETGQQALDVMHDSPLSVNLVITDIGLPDMNGKELIRTIREQYPDIPILAMTGYVDSVLDEALVAIGAAAVFKKPYDTYELSRKIRELLAEE